MTDKKYKIRLDETVGTHRAKKFTCPGCNHKNEFVKYFNFETLEYLPDEFGRCDREERCGYFKTPFQEGEPGFVRKESKFEPEPPKEIKTVDSNIFLQTLQKFELQNLFQFLKNKFGEEQTTYLFKKYFIGTAKDGSSIFWQVDKSLKVRTAQKIQYTPGTHRRSKEIDPLRLFKVSDGYEPCFFGEHLLSKNETAPVFIVESEKTAAVCSMYFPAMDGEEIIWLASSGSNGLTTGKINILEGRQIYLVPDFSFRARAEWGFCQMRKKKVADETGKERTVVAEDGEIDSDYESAKDRLQRRGCVVRFFVPFPETKDGSDLADVLLNLDFKPTEITVPGNDTIPAPVKQETPAAVPVPVYNPHEPIKISNSAYLHKYANWSKLLIKSGVSELVAALDLTVSGASDLKDLRLPVQEIERLLIYRTEKLKNDSFPVEKAQNYIYSRFGLAISKDEVVFILSDVAKENGRTYDPEHEIVIPF